MVLTCLLHSSRDGVGWPNAHNIGRDSDHGEGLEHPQHRQPQLCCFGAFCQQNCSCSITDLAGVACWKRSVTTPSAWAHGATGQASHGKGRKSCHWRQSWPAVVLPFSLKAGFSFAKPSRVVEGLIPSSWCTVIVCWLPSLSWTVVLTGTISALNSPSCWAFAALLKESTKVKITWKGTARSDANKSSQRMNSGVTWYQVHQHWAADGKKTNTAFC